MAYSETQYHSLLLKGNLRKAMAYLGQFPEKADLLARYRAVFEEEQYLSYDADDTVNEILKIYQQYYRNVFYLEQDGARAEETMRQRFCSFFRLTDEKKSFDDMEEQEICQTVSAHGLQMLGGRTGGFYGPYLWKQTERKTYQVELPDGRQQYSVNLLDGFLTRSWLDYLSFGAVGTGGWTNGDGIINCVKSSYDLSSESFRVSLLKHEAQHAMDLAAWPDLSSESLEYRAKLVELIYSQERNMLLEFMNQADTSNSRNGHSLAAAKIVRGFMEELGSTEDGLRQLPIREIPPVALKLFSRSTEALRGSSSAPSV